MLLKLVSLIALHLGVSCLISPPGHSALPTAVTESWFRVESANFICFSNADRTTVTRFLRDLEKLRDVLAHGEMGMSRSRAIPPPMLAFRDLNSFAPYDYLRGDRTPLAQGFFFSGAAFNFLAFTLPQNSSSNGLRPQRDDQIGLSHARGFEEARVVSALGEGVLRQQLNEEWFLSDSS